jgi:hypothetical protein
VTLLHQSSQAVHTTHNVWLGTGVNLLLTNSSDAAVGHNKNECLNDLKRKVSMELNGVDILNRTKDCGLGCHFGLVEEANIYHMGDGEVLFSGNQLLREKTLPKNTLTI